MPRIYKPTGAKKYKKHDEKTIHAALREYEKSKCSLTEISAKYNISKSVLHRHNTRFMKKQGGQRVLSSAAEEYIVEYLNHCSEWAYPLNTYKVRMLIKTYLDRSSLDVKRFKNNLPGPDFVKSFLIRNKDKISQRISQNLKISQPILSAEVIESYFEELELSLEGVPLCNIINYDETNLSDDPKRRKVVIKRSAKYPEKIMTRRKGSTSIMIAASADGELLPCYVVYKDINLEESWTQHGPNSCRYNCTSSGWFDRKCFKDWIYNVALPYFKEKEGKKILIGDSLSTHLSKDLIRECNEQNVHFIFLPATSTHLMQPLDIAFFKVIECAWRHILFTWKKIDSQKLSTVPKSVLPILIKKLLDRIECKATLNIRKGFQKSGIFPLDKNVILERLPQYKSILEENFHEGQRMFLDIETEGLDISDRIVAKPKTWSENSVIHQKFNMNPFKPQPSLTERAKLQYKTAKQIPENKKRNFFIDSIKTTKSKTVNNPSKIKKYQINKTNEGINRQTKDSDVIKKIEKQHYLENVECNYNDNLHVQQHIEISSDVNLLEKSTIKLETIEELFCEDKKVDILEAINEETTTTKINAIWDEIFKHKEDMIYILYV